MDRVCDLFAVHRLNDQGFAKAEALARHFEALVSGIEDLVSPPVGSRGSRELALVATKLQEASYWAKRAMAMQPENQLEVGDGVG